MIKGYMMVIVETHTFQAFFQPANTCTYMHVHPHHSPTALIQILPQSLSDGRVGAWGIPNIPLSTWENQCSQPGTKIVSWAVEWSHVLLGREVGEAFGHKGHTICVLWKMRKDNMEAIKCSPSTRERALHSSMRAMSVFLMPCCWRAGSMVCVGLAKHGQPQLRYCHVGWGA